MNSPKQHIRKYFHKAFCIYSFTASFFIVKLLLLRHAEESPEEFSPYYRETLWYTFCFVWGMSVYCYTKLLFSGCRSAVTLRSPNEFCSHCDSNVHERSYHCVYCRKCCFAAKCHCIWVNRCIGMNSYKILVMLVLYASAAGGIFCYLMLAYMRGRGVPDYLPNVYYKLLLYPQFLVLSFFSLNMMALLLTHCLLLLSNQAMQDLRRDRMHASRPMICANETSEYDLGFLANLRNAMGGDVAMWVIPLDTPMWAVDSDPPRSPLPDLSEIESIR